MASLTEDPFTSELEQDFLDDCAEVLATKPIEDLEIRASLVGILVERRGNPPKSVFDLESLLEAAEGTEVGSFLSRALVLYGPNSTKRLATKVDAKYSSSLPDGQVSRVDGLGKAEADSAFIVTDPYGASTVVSVEFNRTEDSGDASETEGASVLINNSLGGIAGNFSYGIAATQDILDAVSADEDLVKIDITLDKARDLALAAIEARRRSVVDSEEAMAIDELMGIVSHRFESLPATDEPVVSPPAEPVDPESLAAEFACSEVATEFGEGSEYLEAVALEICQFADSLGGDPLRWSPAVAEMFHEGWVHARRGQDQEWIDDVYLVSRAWVRWAGDQKDLAPHLIAQTLVAISELSTPSVTPLTLP